MPSDSMPARMKNRTSFPQSSALVPKPLALKASAAAGQKWKKSIQPKTHEDEIAETSGESEGPSDLTISLEFPRNTKKPRTGLVCCSSGAGADHKPLLPTLPRNACKELMLFGKSLTLCDSDISCNSCIPRIQGPVSKDHSEEEMERKKTASNLAMMVVPGKIEVMDQDRKKGISTELKLYEDPWKIKKKLTDSDLGNLCRLLVASDLIKNHVLPFLPTRAISAVESSCGARIVVWDLDTWTEHMLVLKRWSNLKSYVFIDKWKQEFVRRRNLKKCDEIGLYWDSYYSRMHFAVLKRS